MWGLVQSILATVPVTVTGFVPSYSAANEWCADSAVVPRRPNARITAGFMGVLPIAHCNAGRAASSTRVRELVGFVFRGASDGSIACEMAGRRRGGGGRGSSDE